MSLNTYKPETLTTLGKDILTFARYLCGNADQAQDLRQQVMLNVWTRLQSGEPIENLHAYCMTSLRNSYRQNLRNLHVSTPLDEVMISTVPEVFGVLCVKDIYRAIDRLPPDQNRLMRLVAAGETSPKDLSRLTGWPLGTVMSRLARARVQLRVDMAVDHKAPAITLLQD